jgi:hypothetical protein
MVHEGFLIISDISGYSTYLNESELEHARDSLTDLLNILVAHARSPLVIAKLEGDAVFSYVKRGGILQAETLLATIENTYAAFRKALELMIINTTCTCNACRNLPNLDLKFFIHYGKFSIQRIGTYAELVGNDVNLVHRLLKNSVKTALGIDAYALYSKAVAGAIPDKKIFENLPVHKERYPDVGMIEVFVQDMHEVWQQKKTEMRVVVTEEEALTVLEFDFPVPPMILWDYITKPEYRSILFGSDYQELTNQKGGRIGVDTVYVCAHGDKIFRQTILDWEPFEQYTTKESPPLPGITSHLTHRVLPIETGSKLIMRWGKSMGSWPLRVFADMMGKVLISKNFITYTQLLNEKIQKDLELGNTAFEQTIKINPDLISSAVEGALDRT